MIWKIKVTRDDIGKGKHRMCLLCPVARAIHRATGYEGWNVGVLNVVDSLGHQNHHAPKIYPLPFEAIRWISRFDARYSVEPFYFEIELPEKTNKKT